MRFILHKLHGTKNHREASMLVRCTHVVKETIIRVILAEEGQEAGVKSANQLVANPNWDAILPR
jgi:hypothetical protein